MSQPRKPRKKADSKKPHNPFGTKSLAHPGVFNPASKEAPHGYDNNGRPIKTLQLESEVLPTLSSVLAPGQQPTKEWQQQERERQQQESEKRQRELDEKIERLIYLSKNGGLGMKGAPTEESNLTGWGYERREYGAFGVPLAFPRYHYPTLLELTRQQLVELLDTQVGTKDETIVDPTKEPRTIVVPAKRYVLASPRFFEMTEELKGLDEQIAKSEKLLASYNVASEKRAVKRGEISAESARDAKTFKRLRAEEGHVLEQLRKKRRALKAEVDAEAKRLDDSAGTIPEHTIEAFIEMTVQKPVLFRDVFVIPTYVDVDYSSSNDAVGTYVNLVKTLGNDSHVSADWKYLENEIVVQALGRQLIPLPSNEILERFRPCDIVAITRYMAGVVPESPKPAAEEEEAADERGHDPREIALLRKTGAAPIGGQIYGAGTDDKGRKRSLSGFDKVIGKRRWNRGDEAGEHEDAAEDYSEHGPGDNGEAHEPD